MNTYDKDTIDAKFFGVHGILEEQNKTLDRIENTGKESLKAVKETNGSVAAIKERQAKQEGVSTVISWAGSTLIVVIFGILGFFFLEYVKIKTQIVNAKELQTAVQAGISQWVANYNTTLTK